MSFLTELRIVDAGVTVPKGNPLVIDDTWYVHTTDWWTQQYKGGFPLYTRHMLGCLEAERDRRKHEPLGH